MKWEIDPSVLLKVSGTASLLFGLSAATSPKNFHDTYSTSVSERNCAANATRHNTRRPAPRPAPRRPRAERGLF